MARLLKGLGMTALATALLLPTALPLTSHAQQAGNTTTTAPKTRKKAKHKSAPVPSGNSANTPDPINPSGSPEPPTPTTQGPPLPATTPSTNTPVAPH